MRITFLYPEDREDFAQKALARLARLSEVDVATVAIGRGNLRQDLRDACEDGEPIVLALSSDLIRHETGVVRELWAPLLRRVEASGAQNIGMILIDEMVLPPLLLRARRAQAKDSLRALESWAIAWSLPNREISGPVPHSVDGMDEDLLEMLLQRLVDESASLKVSCSCACTRTRCAADFALCADSYFEAVQSLYVPHRVAALRDAVVKQIAAAGRTLWILDGYEGPMPDRPEFASILVLGETGGIAIPAAGREAVAMDMDEVLERSLQLLPLIPNVAGIELPFSTFELEELLPALFKNHWILAERLARKAGVFFRVNHRMEEAIWLYNELKRQAEQHGQAACVEDCDNELYWLRAGRNRKVQGLHAEQGSFEF